MLTLSNSRPWHFGLATVLCANFANAEPVWLHCTLAFTEYDTATKREVPVGSRTLEFWLDTETNESSLIDLGRFESMQTTSNFVQFESAPRPAGGAVSFRTVLTIDRRNLSASSVLPFGSGQCELGRAENQF